MNPNGRYTSRVPAGAAGGELDLRVDVSSNGPFNVVSADLFAVSAAEPPARQYIGTWIVDTPVTTDEGGHVAISGAVRFLTSQATGNLRVVVDPTQAMVEFTDGDGKTEGVIACSRVSDMLRSLDVFVDMVSRAGVFIGPAYNTGFLPGPAGLTARPLDLESALNEAGLAVRETAVPGPINDSSTRSEAWSDDELRELLASRFLQQRPEMTWPQWSIWALFASVHEQPGIQGVMFDDLGAQQRQGLAIFRKQPAFDMLSPLNGAQPSPFVATAMRQYLFTWIHELGHALNLEHPSQLGPGNVLSWMNNPALIDSILGSGSFWNRFGFGFGQGELMHLRHGALNDVIPGGAPFAGNESTLSTGFPELPATSASGDLDLLVRPRSSYRWLAPVKIEVRLLNHSDQPVEIDTRLHPEHGRLILFIRRPDGSVHRYVPLTRKLAAPDPRQLEARGSTRGWERYSASIDITYGSRGFSFREPGQYIVRAYYRGAPSGLVISKDAVIEVADPTGDEERWERDYFRSDVGTCLYFRGSRSPRLRAAMGTLRRLMVEHGDEMTRADLALTITRGFGRRFYGLKGDDLKLRCLMPARPDEGIALTTEALEIYRRNVTKLSSLQYSRLVYHRAGFWRSRRQPQPERAAKELRQLRADLALIANPPVLDQIQHDADSCEHEKANR